MPHLKNNAFYLIVDVSAVEKAYAKFGLTNGLESLSYVIRNLKDYNKNPLFPFK